MIFAAVTIAAALERWWFSQAWHEAASPTSAFYYGDATRFLDYASAIVEGRTYDNGVPYHPPGWPFLLAFVMRVAGSGAPAIRTLKLLTGALSAASVGASAVLAGEAAGLGAMLAVAFLGVFNFGHIVEGTVLGSEALYGLLIAFAVWTSWRWFRDQRASGIGWAAATGAAAGAAMLVRAEFLACAVVLGAIAVKRGIPRSELVASVVSFAIVLLPTTVWHWRTLTAFNKSHAGRLAGPLPVFVPVTSYGPFNFAMANHADADGGPNRDHPMLELCDEEGDRDLAVGQIDLACPAIYDLYVHGYAIGARWIAEHPAAAFELVGRKLSLTMGFLAHGYLADDRGPGVDGTRRRVDLVDPDMRRLIPIHLLLFAAGVAALRRQPLARAVLAAPLAAFAASVVLFYGYVRLGVAYMPVIWVLQGAGIASLLSVVTGWQANRRYILPSLLALALLLGYERSVRDQTRRLSIDGAHLPDGTLMQDESLEVHREIGRYR